jgi:exonuclease III
MNLICWNCRGLGNLRTARELHHLVKTKHPHILSLMETRMKNCSLQRLRVQFGFQGLFAVDLVGLSGGLALFWRDNNAIEVQNYSRRHISARIRTESLATPWSFTGFYGLPDRSLREESWKLLSHIGSL